MKNYVYPAVIYYDEDGETYVLVIEDANIYVEGDTVEEAHKRGGQFLAVYLECAHTNDCEIPTPSDFEKLVKDNPAQMVVLVEAVLDANNKRILS